MSNRFLELLMNVLSRIKWVANINQFCQGIQTESCEVQLLTQALVNVHIHDY